MLKQETVQYIIEKMRGDSLTPLGTGKGDNDGEYLLNLLKVENGNIPKDINTMSPVWKDFSNKLYKHLSKDGTTFLKGQWITRRKNRSILFPLHFIIDDECGLWLTSSYNDEFVSIKLRLYTDGTSKKSVAGSIIKRIKHISEDRDKISKLIDAFIVGKFG